MTLKEDSVSEGGGVNCIKDYSILILKFPIRIKKGDILNMRKKLFYLILVLVSFGLTTQTANAEIDVPNGGSIQAAIAAAGNGETIHVAAGIYKEFITISKSVILLGDPGAILEKPSSGNGHGFLVQAADITISGFEIRGFQIGIRSAGWPGLYGNLSILNCSIHHNTQNGMLIVYDAFNTIRIENCQINNNSQIGIGIADHLTYAKSIDTLKIVDTIVSGNAYHGMFLSNTAVSNILIQNSSFDSATAYGQGGITFGTNKSVIGSFSMTGGSLSNNAGCGLAIVQAPSFFGGITLDGIEINNNHESGVQLGGGASTNSLTVRNCIFRSNSWEDFDLSGGWYGSFKVAGPTSFMGNSFSGTAWNALYIGADGNFQNGITVNRNNFFGNYGRWGIYNTTAMTVDATCNYWGDSSGPRNSGNPAGLGNSTTNNINFVPWLASPVGKMASFFIQEAKLDFKKKADDDKILAKGRFVLGNCNNVNPADPVTVIIEGENGNGKFNEEITMYAKGKGEKWEYKAPKDGAGIKDMSIEWKNGEGKFDIHIKDAELGLISSWKNPVKITIKIGSVLGFQIIEMKEHKDKWEYHN